MKQLYVILLAIGSLALGTAIGYLYRDRSAEFERYDSTLLDLSTSILMSDALERENYEALKASLAADIEGEISSMVLLYSRYSFSEGERVRCAVTRKARILFENGEILASRETLKDLGYPYDQVKAYFESNCEGKPSHDNWTTVGNSE